MNHPGQPKKSDPIQGILFKSPPVHLQGRAMKRAQQEREEVTYYKNFFLKAPKLKASPLRISRRFKKPKTTRITTRFED